VLLVINFAELSHILCQVNVDITMLLLEQHMANGVFLCMSVGFLYVSCDMHVCKVIADFTRFAFYVNCYLYIGRPGFYLLSCQ